MKKLILIFVYSSFAFAVPFEGQKMLVAAPSPYAVTTAEKIISKGGNVVDVAVAMGLTLSVTSPYFAALGGGGLALVRINNQTVAIDFREVAPLTMGENSFKEAPQGASRVGGLAVGVPGFPAGLYEIHHKYGKLKWAALFEDALQLSSKGFYVSGEWVRNTASEFDHFTDTAKKIFFKNNKSYGPRELFVQKNLHQALLKFKTGGMKAFYEGEVAKDIVDSIHKANGKMTLEDLKKYKVEWLEPMKTTLNDHQIYTMPPPSSGGVVIQTALKLVNQLDLEKTPPLSVDEYHLLGEVLSRSFRGRSLLGDPNYVKNPLDMLLSKDYIDKLVKSISRTKAQDMEPLSEENLEEPTETTHYSVLDKEGNAVSLTVTLNGDYGSGVVSEKFGIALNNEMDDFMTHPKEPNMFGLIQGRANRVQGGKRPLSSMSPTLAEKDGKIVLALGAPGGPRIISGVFQVLYRVLTRGLNIDQAIQSPRIHQQFLPRKLFVERNRFSPEMIASLRKMGHTVEDTPWVARVNGVRLNDKGFLEAGFDSRGEGAAGGF